MISVTDAMSRSAPVAEKLVRAKLKRTRTAEDWPPSRRRLRKGQSRSYTKGGIDWHRWTHTYLDRCVAGNWWMSNVCVLPRMWLRRGRPRSHDEGGLAPLDTHHIGANGWLSNVCVCSPTLLVRRRQQTVDDLGAAEEMADAQVLVLRVLVVVAVHGRDQHERQMQGID
jgi:hypothetical protein